MDNEKVYRQCGAGWNSLIDPLVKRCTELGGIVDEIKEKYGTLRFYFTPLGPAADGLWDAFQDIVDQAEHESHWVCELCGKRGYGMRKGIWLKTLCNEHSLELGYKDRA
jgi:hypothetical protein